MPLAIGILTISDRVSRGAMEDTGRLAIEDALGEGDWRVRQRAVVPDDRDRIAAMLRQWSDEEQLDVIFTTGGTGLSPRDVTPEATTDIAERVVPGIAEAMRAAGLRQTPTAMLSRAMAVTRGQTLIVNLPGSPSGAQEGTEVVRPILQHAVAIMHGGRH